MACAGSPTKIELVDEAGHPVVAKGELRDAQGTRPFDCADAPSGSAFEFGCSDGTLSIPAAQTQHSTNEVRFVKDDGSLTDWQPFTITATRRTDEDFNGPGCACSWFEGTTKPLLVPEDARNPLPQPLLNLGGASPDP